MSNEPEHPRTILIVDDDEIFRQRLGRAFSERGYEVRMAADVEQAHHLAAEDPPEYVVLDLRMPGALGLSLIEKLKALDPGTQIVMLTGYGSIATAVEAMRLGASSYLAKPADVDDIVLAFQRLDTPPLEPPDLPKGSYIAPSLARTEWEHINRVLSDCGHNISEAARRLGIHRRSLQRKLYKYPPRV